MRTLEEINKIMQTIPEKWRTHWCRARICACCGCVQTGNKIIMYEKMTGEKFHGDPEYISSIPDEIYNQYKVTEDEWNLWMNNRIEF